MRNTSWYCFSVGLGILSWGSKKQNSVSQFIAEVEYVVVARAANQRICLKKILVDIGGKKQGSVEFYCDNKLAIAIKKNPVYHSQTKNISIKYHYLHEVEASGEIQLKFCSTKE